ncbi:multiheme c-type cytochrome [Rubripirellula lacrimiformis]|nr:multiheme c-type cytochrome [Rubripirellula lacrimiformis]
MNFWSGDSFLATPEDRPAQSDLPSITPGRREVAVALSLRLRSMIVTGMAGLAIVGCAPADPAASRNQELAVGMPTGQSADPGVLTDTEIQPPPLLGVAGTPAQMVSIRMGEATNRVQWSDQSSAPAVDSFRIAQATVIQQPPRQPELIPTPKGELDSKDKKPADPSTPPSLDPSKPNPKDSPSPQDPSTEDQNSPPRMENGSPSLAGPDAGSASDAGDSQPTGVDLDPAFPGMAGGPEDYRTWDTPGLTLVFSGQQHGYIEPCGCTGLDRQKGGVARRYTFIDSLAKKGWPLLPMDAGNQVRRYGRQAAIKLQQSVRALNEMGYEAVGFGPDDVRLGVGDLLVLAAEQEIFVSANVVLFDPEYVPKTKLIEKNGWKIGVTSILDPESLEVPPDDSLLVNDPEKSAKEAASELAGKSPDFSVLLYFGKEESAKELVRKVGGFDLIVVAGGYGEPTYQAESIDGSKTRIIVTGDKGMYAGLIGLYADKPMKYARVPLTHEFGDAPEMRAVMKDYQDQLRDLGLGELGLLPPIKHSSNQQFVGSEACGKCHTTAYEIWESSAHAEATEHLVHPPAERSDISRHFDPECISCHVTGWNPQEYYPYESGYLSLAQTPHLTGNGCENCHGPGAAHAAAEADGSTAAATLRDELRRSMQLPLEKAREKCMSCHDLDNSPDFHQPDAFEDIYWPEVEHYGVD